MTRRPLPGRERSQARRKLRNGKPFRRQGRSQPGRGQRKGREGDPLFFASAGLALLDAALRADPPAAGALRSRLALQSAAASANMPCVNADEAALRDLSFAVGDPLGPAANLFSIWRDCAGRPPSLDPGRIGDAAARLDLALPDPNGLASRLMGCAGEGDPVSAAARVAALAFSAVPDAPAGSVKANKYRRFSASIQQSAAAIVSKNSTALAHPRALGGSIEFTLMVWTSPARHLAQ